MADHDPKRSIVEMLKTFIASPLVNTENRRAAERQLRLISPADAPMMDWSDLENMVFGGRQ